MTTNEVFEELTNKWMANEEAARVFGYNVGDNFDDHYSKVSVIRLLFWVVASVIALKETLLDEWKESVKKVAEDTHYGTSAWWKKAAFDYEVGKDLVVVDGKVGYATIDESKRIITAASVTELGRVIKIKVAKGEVGNLSPLSAEELQSFNGYLNAIKPLGLIVSASSESANNVIVNGVLTYEGEYLKSDIEERVNEAINGYLKNLEFGGIFYIGRMVSEILKVDGVVNADIDSVMIDNVNVDGKASPSSGYAILSANNFTYEYK